MDQKRWILVYSCMIVLALLSGHYDLLMKQRLQKLSQKVQKALRLSAIERMESLESQRLHFDATREQEKAQEIEEKSERLFYQAKMDQENAMRDEIEGKEDLTLMEQERQEAHELFQRANAKEKLRLEVLANLTKDEEKEEELSTAIENIHKGICAWQQLGRVCDMIGGATQLEKQEVDEYRKIHDEWQEAQEIGEQEFMEELLASILDKKASQYNETAQDLIHLSELWNQRAAKDYAAAVHDNVTANVFYEEADQVEQRAENVGNWEQKKHSIVHYLLLGAEEDHVTARRYAGAAVLLAILPMAVFLFRAVPRCFLLFMSVLDWSTTENTDDVEFWRMLSYCIQHVLILFLSVGFSRNYLTQMDNFSIRERAIVVIWVAFLGSSIQSLALHAVPHAMAATSLGVENVGEILKQSSKRLFTLYWLFLIEVLLMWLTFGNSLFSFRTTAILSHWLFVTVTLLAICCHVCFFEPRSIRMRDDHSTVFSDEKSETFSESTPLRSPSDSAAGSVASTFTSSTGEALRQMILGRRDRYHYRSVETIYGQRAISRSPYNVLIVDEIPKLLLPFEILLIACMAAILRNALPIIFSRHSASSLWISVAIFVGILAMACLAIKQYEDYTGKTPRKTFQHYELASV